MNYAVKEIELEKTFNEYTVNNDDKSKCHTLAALSKINILVGANNAGKSRFLRNLANIGDMKFHPSASKGDSIDPWKEIQSCCERFVSQAMELYRTTHVGTFSVAGQFEENPNTLKAAVLLKPIREKLSLLESIVNRLRQIANLPDKVSAFRQVSYIGNAPTDAFLRSYRELAKNALIRIEQQRNEHQLPDSYQFRKIYFPTLRGLRPFDLHNDHYLTRTKKDYFPNAICDIVTGMTIYDDVKKMKTGGVEERERIREFEEFLSDRFFEGTKIELVPKRDSDVLDVRIGAEDQFPIFNLGDGVQAIILLTFPLFQSESANILAFFEEPEIYMHPGLQRTFLDALDSFDNCQIFLTTHSNHLLDITMDLPDVSIYTFSKHLERSSAKVKKATFVIENVRKGDFRPLELLGVRNSSVFLSNCTIWVEGVTDRRYLLRYLELYMQMLKDNADPSFRRFNEDLHYSFVEYGGANITHWSFLDTIKDSINVERLCSKLFLITDNDNVTDNAKAERHKKLQQKLGDRYYRLAATEIENLLPPEVIKKIVGQYEGGMGNLKDFKQEDYKNKRLGEFIESDVLNGPRTRKGSYRDDSGTIRMKVEFCERALNEIKDFSQLSQEAQALAKRLYEFIKEHNT